MFVTARGSTLRLLYWQWKAVLVFASAATVTVLLHKAVDLDWLVLPTTPLSVVGAAIGIFVSFRTNSSYDRWWEGRKLWGRLINTSRHWSTQSVTYFAKPEQRGIAQRLVKRHIAYVHALRCLLRKQDPFADEDFPKWLEPGELEAVRNESNLTHALLQNQLTEVCELSDRDELDAFRLQSMDLSVRHLLDIQGGCERIKKTPFPTAYGFIASRLIWAFSLLFPLAIVSDLGWFTIPVNVLVCLSFSLIGEVGRVLEDPFSLFWNGLPLSAMSRTIERNLRQRIGDTELPPELVPSPQGILM